MKTILTLLFLTSTVAFSQDKADTLWGSKKFKMGFTVQLGPAWWDQPKLNTLLLQNNLPVTKQLSKSIGIGNIFQWDDLRLTQLVLFGGHQTTGKNENLEYRFYGGEINGERVVYRNKKISVAPIVGAGGIESTVKVSRQTKAGSISNPFTSRNTTELFTRQGFVNAGVNVGFLYLPSKKAHILQATAGYRYGFMNTDLSTDKKEQTIEDLSSDPVRQFYLSLKINIMYLSTK